MRQYALKALAALPLPPEAAPLIARIRDEDEKPYNRDEAADLLRQSGATHDAEPPAQPRPAAPGADLLTRTTPQAPEPSQAVQPSPQAPPAPIALEALNRLLEAAYGEPRRLSELLRGAGLDEGAIAALRRERLAPYLDLLAQRLRAWLQRLVPERTADVFIRRFELDGRPAPTLAELGAQYGISRERVRQIEVKVLKRLRSRRAREAIEQIIADAAREILGLPASAPGVLAAPAVPRQAASSALATLARFEAGLSPAQIAAERGLAEGTVYAHLAACIRSGSTAAARAVTPAMVGAVRAVMEGDDPPVSFTELRHRMPAAFSYGHVLCVIAAHPELLPETRALTPEEVERARVTIRALVADVSGELPRSGAIKILVGSPSKRVVSQRDHPAYGALAGFDHAALWQIIDDLVIAGELALDEHSRLVYLGAPFVSPYRGHELATVLRALERQQHPDFALAPGDIVQLRDLGLITGDRLPEDLPRRVGRALYNALVREQGIAALALAGSQAARQGRPLALRLLLPPEAVELAALPWELLWEDRPTPLLLSATPSVLLTRHLDLPDPLPPAVARGGRPLRILALSPQVERARGEHTILAAGLAQVWAELRAHGAAEVVEVSPATRDDLALAAAFQPDIVQFTGHGWYADGRGLLFFDPARPEATADLVDADQMAAALRGARMVVLAACRGAQSAGIEGGAASLLTGVVPALSAAGVPAVVGMQLAVRAEAALRATRAIYGALAHGLSAQAAVGRARDELYVVEPERNSWYVPVLYVRSRESGPIYL